MSTPPEAENGGDGASQGIPTGILNFPTDIEHWTNAEKRKCLDKIFARTVALVQSRIDLYDDKASKQSKIARRLRRVTIVLVSSGAILPLAATFLGTNASGQFAQLGYIVLAVAGSLVLFDNFFGHSSTWIRYRVIQSELIKRLVAFRFEWVNELSGLGPNDISTPNVQRLIQLARRVAEETEAAVSEETRLWAESFNSRIQAFDQLHNFKSLDRGTATVAVSISNFSDLKPETVELLVGREKVDLQNGQAVKSVEPGTVKIDLNATGNDDKPLTASQVVSLARGDVVPVTLTAEAATP